jgi:AcrR family transcriptional regulator
LPSFYHPCYPMPIPSSAPALGARARLLGAAHQLFYQQGIRATSIDHLLATAKVARMSFYKYFPSKQALVVTFLQERHSQWQQQLEQQAKARAQTPLAEALAVFEVLGDWFGEADFRGCAFINTVLETADPTTEEHKIAQAQQVLRAYLEGLLVAAGFATPSLGAAQLLLLLDGAIVRAQLGDGPAAAQLAQAMAKQLLYQPVEITGQPEGK